MDMRKAAAEGAAQPQTTVTVPALHRKAELFLRWRKRVGHLRSAIDEAYESVRARDEQDTIIVVGKPLDAVRLWRKWVKLRRARPPSPHAARGTDRPCPEIASAIL